MTDLPNSQKIRELSQKWMDGTISPEERIFLFNWYDSFDDTQLELDPQEARLFNQLQQDMLKDIRERLGHSSPPMRKLGFLRPAAAAAAIFLLAAGTWYFTRSKGRPATVAATSPSPRQDIGPGSDKATLTLADGSTINLDNASAGSLATQGGAQVSKAGDNRITYTAATTPSEEKTYNILTTPKGGQYRLTLQDGTQVWLNAGSSIRYPTAFSGKERRVEITGEAYFDVARNPGMPFRVAVKGFSSTPAEIDVLGTRFNVNAYSDEPEMRTTLLEGAVRLATPAASATLRPDQQAFLGSSGEMRTAHVPDADEVIAWKEGAFEFDHAEITTVMRQISRWYDVEIIYQGPVTADRFSGRFSRRTSLAGVLKIMNISGVQLMAENKKIIIRSS
ncbi:MAG: FecR domain-containing protein [Bacteroidetes bacterium]|nr:FecR domain-containing protein [Bacteroidota bacterium]